MAAFIFKDDGDTAADITFWNRRESRWQADLTRSCIYPTMKGAQPVLQRLFNSQHTDHFEPLQDWLGAHCLADFASHDYQKFRIPFG